jgi:hypothetical protein
MARLACEASIRLTLLRPIFDHPPVHLGHRCGGASLWHTSCCVVRVKRDSLFMASWQLTRGVLNEAWRVEGDHPLPLGGHKQLSGLLLLVLSHGKCS